MLEEPTQNLEFFDEEQKDACDYAKGNGLAEVIPTFMDCSLKKKKADMTELERRLNDRG